MILRLGTVDARLAGFAPGVTLPSAGGWQPRLSYRLVGDRDAGCRLDVGDGSANAPLAAHNIRRAREIACVSVGRDSADEREAATDNPPTSSSGERMVPRRHCRRGGSGAHFGDN